MKFVTPKVWSATEGGFSRASTATYVGADGLVHQADVDVLRVSYDYATGLCAGALVEAAGRNMLSWSSDAGNALFIKTAGASVSYPATPLAPDGSATANLLTTVAAESGFYTYSLGAAGLVSYTVSLYAKAAASSTLNLTVGNPAQTQFAACDFNLATGVATITSAVSDGTVATLSIADASSGTARHRWQLRLVGGTWADAVGSANPSAPGMVVFQATGLIPGRWYEIQVRAETVGGNSAWVAGPNFRTDDPTLLT